MAAIGGGVTNAGIASAAASSSRGIIYGTGAGYASGIRRWGGVWQGGSIPQGAGGGRADVPLGLGSPTGRVSILALPSVPKLVPTFRTPGYNPSAPLRTNQPQKQKELYVAAKVKRPTPAVIVRTARPTPRSPTQTLYKTVKRPDTMGEVTDIFANTLSQVAIAWAGRAQPVAATIRDMGKMPGSGIVGGNGYEMGGGLPGVDCIPEPDPQQCGPKPVWKYSCGGYRWVYPKRRRRRQLLTNSDAAGLAKLKGLVGVGKTMDAWIATHS